MITLTVKESSTVQCDRAYLEKQNSTLWQNILISCKKIYKDAKSDYLNPVRIVSTLFLLLSMFSLYTVITAKCKVYWPLPPQSVFVFFFSRRYFAFMIVHTSSPLHDCSHFLILITASTECIDLFSPIHYKANRGESHHTWIQKLQFPDVTRGSDYSTYHNQFLNICINIHMHCKVGFPTKWTRTKVF